MGAVDWPTSGSRAFGAARATHTHNGVDFAALEGAPVYAARPGRIAWATREPTQGFAGYGRVVVVDVGDGTSHLYGHLLEPRRAVGELVAAGDVIGRAGRTQYAHDDPTDARSTMGPHLHYEVSPAPYPLSSSSPRLDPLAYLLAAGDAYHPTAGVRVGVARPLQAPAAPAIAVAPTFTPWPAAAPPRAAAAGAVGFVVCLAAGGALALLLHAGTRART